MFKQIPLFVLLAVFFYFAFLPDAAEPSKRNEQRISFVFIFLSPFFFREFLENLICVVNGVENQIEIQGNVTDRFYSRFGNRGKKNIVISLDRKK